MLLKHQRRWEVRSAGNGSKGERWYAWAWIATASPRHHLLVRRHLKTGELAFHYCFVPEGQLLTKTQAIEQAHAPAWLKDQLRARRQGRQVASPRARTALIAWRDARRTVAAACRRAPA